MRDRGVAFPQAKNAEPCTCGHIKSIHATGGTHYAGTPVKPKGKCYTYGCPCPKYEKAWRCAGCLTSLEGRAARFWA